MKCLIMGVMMAWAVILQAVVPTVSDASVSIEQNGNSRLVRIDYELEGAAAVVSAELTLGGARVTGSALASLSGDVNTRVAPGEKTIWWKPDMPFEASALEVSLKAYSVENPPDYMVIDCVVDNAPVRFYAAEDQLPLEGGVTNIRCKTEWLVLRKIPAREITWRMGRSGVTSGYSTPHRVTLSENYYMAVFEMTRQQEAFLSGGGISGETDSTNPQGYPDIVLRPAGTLVNPEALRGALTDSWRGWPQEGHDVLEGSKIHSFRQRTPVVLDLPTAAQWEFAARAGCGEVYTDGSRNCFDAALEPLAWFDANTTGNHPTQPVGGKKPNNWGLYDVLGNEYEQCLDWYENAASSDGRDPKGPTNEGKTLTTRVYRSYSTWNSSSQATLDAAVGLYDARTYRLCAPCYAPGDGDDGEEGEGEPIGEKKAQWLDPVRIVLVGDGIFSTGESSSLGFVRQMRAAFDEVHLNRKTTVVTLGFTGGYVGYWNSYILPGSVDKAYYVDNNMDVHKELAVQNPDWLVLGLGATEVDVPYVNDDSQVTAWKTKYTTLLDSLIARCAPKKIAICTPPPITEDPTSPKNAMINSLSAVIREICSERNYAYVPTHEDAFSTLERARRLKGDAHVSDDTFFYPNDLGGYSLAVTLLKGIVETNAAEWVRTRKYEPYFRTLAANAPILTLRRLSAESAGSGAFTFTFAYDWTDADGATNAPAVTATSVPDGWTVVSAANGRLVVTGTPQLLENVVSLTAGGKTASCTVPAPWSVVADVAMNYWTTGNLFDSEAADRDATCSIDYAGHAWQPYFATHDYRGYGVDAVNFAQLCYVSFYKGGFGRRKVWSGKDRDVTLKVARTVTGSDQHVRVYVNDVIQFDANITKTAEQTVTVHLNAGWNTIGFRSAHRTYYHQHAISFEPLAGDELSDLRYALP